MSDLKGRPIRALVPMACDGVGPSFTAARLMQGAYTAGFSADMFVNRYRMPKTGLPVHVALPGPFGHLPYRRVEALASRLIEARYEASLAEGDIAYLFPAVSLQLHETLQRRGVPIVLEGINTRMASAKVILDAAYDAFGAPAGHGITDDRIAEEEAKYATATTIFAPSGPVEQALAGSPLASRFQSSSYGTDTGRSVSARDYAAAERPLTFLFCGYASIRKGIHHLLDAWAVLPGTARLRIVGRIEPLIAERYRDILASDRIETVGFVKDVHPHFAEADVFVMPSLEEGDPLVTYEAALHGLPVIASVMGGGRMGDVAGRMILVDPVEPDALALALAELAGSTERREMLGTGLRRVVQDYDWAAVGARRAAMLQKMFS
ncbi:MAG: hypothetical protein DI533_21065 [Cereibacter sphaeroides]|uniref:Glycosyltransferase n=1 Tax=Cereibacter sphaeroides TaxID=1063 RepID=A0A2W5S768_CERSP|nr:MAG: hypothetical protein DI533_21065 [Cereibacter sphaeroides]